MMAASLLCVWLCLRSLLPVCVPAFAGHAACCLSRLPMVWSESDCSLLLPLLYCTAINSAAAVLLRTYFDSHMYALVHTYQVPGTRNVRTAHRYLV